MFLPYTSVRLKQLTKLLQSSSSSVWVKRVYNYITIILQSYTFFLYFHTCATGRGRVCVAVGGYVYTFHKQCVQFQAQFFCTFVLAQKGVLGRVWLWVVGVWCVGGCFCIWF